VSKQKREDKAVVVDNIKEKLQSSDVSVLTDYRGLTVAEIDDLRRKLREANVEYKVLKNTLTWRAAQELGLEELKTFLEGPTAIAFSSEDPVAPAKVLSDFAKKHKALEIKGGVLEGNVISLEKIKALAELPPKEQLLAQVVSAMQAPISGLVNVLQGPIRNFVWTLEAVRVHKEKEA